MKGLTRNNQGVLELKEIENVIAQSRIQLLMTAVTPIAETGITKTMDVGQFTDFVK